MRYFFLLVTVCLQYLLVHFNRLIDSLNFIMVILIGMLAAGALILIVADRKKHMLRQAGWGLMAGSTFSILCIFFFLLWVSGSLK